MKRLDIYIGRSVIAGTLLALLALVAIDAMIDFINETEDVGKHGYTLLQAVLVTVLTTPQRLYEFFPTAALVGGLLSLGNLAAHGELVAIRAAGVAKSRIIVSVLMTGFVMMLISIAIGEWLAPASEQRARVMSNVSSTDQISLKTRHGLWARDGNRFINAREVFPDFRLRDVWVYQIKDLQLEEMVHAGSAEYRDNHWLMKDVRRSRISTEGVVASTQKQEFWQRLLPTSLFAVIVIDPEQMSAGKLWRYIQYLRDNQLDSGRYLLAYWTRYTVPLSTLVMLLLAMPFVFASARMGGVGQRLFAGAVLGLAVHLINRALNHLSIVYGFPPFLGATLPLMLFLAVGLIAVYRTR